MATPALRSSTKTESDQASPNSLSRTEQHASSLDAGLLTPMGMSPAGRRPSMMKDPATGKIVWHKGKVIGCGAFGKVFLGLDGNSGNLIAAKEIVFDESEPNLDAKIAALSREIGFMRTLKHNNIVDYINSERDETTFFIFMEYVPGGSLQALVEQFGSLSDTLVAGFTRQILDGLAYLHRNNVVHRDIKCANILVNVDGVVKLADFGSAQHFSQCEGFMGTPHWMAPEVVKGDTVSWQADIWSLGCAVMEMLTGKPPFAHLGNQFRIMRFIAGAETIEFPEGQFSPAAESFLKACLQRDPEKRSPCSLLLRHPFLMEDGTIPPELRRSSSQGHSAPEGEACYPPPSMSIEHSHSDVPQNLVTSVSSAPRHSPRGSQTLTTTDHGLTSDPPDEVETGSGDDIILTLTDAEMHRIAAMKHAVVERAMSFCNVTSLASEDVPLDELTSENVMEIMRLSMESEAFTEKAASSPKLSKLATLRQSDSKSSGATGSSGAMGQQQTTSPRSTLDPLPHRTSSPRRPRQVAAEATLLHSGSTNISAMSAVSYRKIFSSGSMRSSASIRSLSTSPQPFALSNVPSTGNPITTSVDGPKLGPYCSPRRHTAVPPPLPPPPSSKQLSQTFPPSPQNRPVPSPKMSAAQFAHSHLASVTSPQDTRLRAINGFGDLALSYETIPSALSSFQTSFQSPATPQQGSGPTSSEHARDRPHAPWQNTNTTSSGGTAPTSGSGSNSQYPSPAGIAKKYLSSREAELDATALTISAPTPQHSVAERTLSHTLPAPAPTELEEAAYTPRGYDNHAFTESSTGNDRVEVRSGDELTVPAEDSHNVTPRSRHDQDATVQQRQDEAAKGGCLDNIAIMRVVAIVASCVAFVALGLLIGVLIAK